jgi:hypothetical protein
MCRTLSDPVATLQYATPVPFILVSLWDFSVIGLKLTSHPKINGDHQVWSRVGCHHY